MAKYLFNDAAPTDVDNKKFKRRTKAGVPKMNFHIWAIPRDDGTNTPSAITDWRYIGGFTDLSGLSVSTNVQETNDSDTSRNTIKSAGDNTYGDITLNKGFDSDNFMGLWSAQIQADDGNSDRYLLDLVIFKLTADDTRIAKCYLVKNAWVSNYVPGDMDTTTTDPWVHTVTLTIDAWAEGFPSADSVDGDGEPNLVDPIAVGSDTAIEKTYYLYDDFTGGYTLEDDGSGGKTYTPRLPDVYFDYTKSFTG